MNTRTNRAFVQMAFVIGVVLMACSSSTPPSDPAPTYVLTGKITPSMSESVSGITVSIGSASVITDATGAYSFTGLSNGTYVLTPAKGGLTFEPVTRSVTVAGANATAGDFVAKTTRSYELPEMVAIEPGTFMMGAIVGQRGNPEYRPQHSVTITRGLWVSKYEVTQAQYESVVGTNPSEWKGAMRPMTNVTVADIAAYCNKLSEMEGLQKAYVINAGIVSWDRSANGYRLPTSAEWEYFARAGTTDNTYAGINDGTDPNAVLESIAWYGTNSIDADGKPTSRSVGLKQPNAWGLYDVLGNVQEVCFESQRTYTADPQTDPWAGVRNDSVVVRGGNCGLRPRDMAISNAIQLKDLPSKAGGVRLVRYR